MKSAKSAMYIGVSMLGLGGLLIILGWNGAAGLDYVSGQLPFILSGGIGGLALIAGGLTWLVINNDRRDNQLLMHKLDELIDTVARSGVGGPSAVPDEAADRVVAGRTTYHRQSCHLIEGRSDLQVMSAQTAIDRGLAPCRVCEPERAVSSVEVA